MSKLSPENWSSRIGVILAVTGSAVGLGNFLRFPGLAAKYDGGAFMIPYFVALLLLGLPLAWAEWSMGRYGGTRGFHSSPGIFRVLWKNPAAPYLGVLGLIVPVVIYMYYVFVESWCLGYAWHYLTGALDLGRDPEAYKGFFAGYVGMQADGSIFSNILGAPLVFLVICIALNFILINRGLTRGIELFCLWAMPALAVCAVLVLIRVLTLGTPDPGKPELNVLNGLGEMWNPATSDKSLWELLANGKMWMEAAGQIFFSLSVGFGVIITYASYMRRNDDIALSSTTAVAGNEFFEVSLGGMITIPAAFVFLGAAGVVGGTFALGFNTLPLVFEQMPFGRVVGFLWFFLLFLAAITSSISMLQPAIAFLQEGLGLNRGRAVALLCGVGSLGTLLVVWFSKDLAAMDTLDFWVGTFCIYVLACVQTFIFGWIFGTKRGLEELDRGADLRVPRLFAFVIKYISPVYLLIVFIAWARHDVGERIQSFADDAAVRWTLLFLAVLFVAVVFCVRYAAKRWTEQPDELSEYKATPDPALASGLLSNLLNVPPTSLTAARKWIIVPFWIGWAAFALLWLVGIMALGESALISAVAILGLGLFVFSFFLIHFLLGKMMRGANWARVVFIVLDVWALLTAPASLLYAAIALYGLPVIGVPIFVISVANIAIPLVTLLYLCKRECAEWFTKVRITEEKLLMEARS